MKIFYKILIATSLSSLIPLLLMCVAIIQYDRLFLKNLVKYEVHKVEKNELLNKNDLSNIIDFNFDLKSGKFISCNRKDINFENIYNSKIVESLDDINKDTPVSLRYNDSLYKGYCSKTSEVKGRCILVSEDYIEKNKLLFFLKVLIFFIIITATLIFISVIVVSKRIVRPIEYLSKYLTKLPHDNWHFDLKSDSNDEIGSLINTLRKYSEKINKYRREYEQGAVFAAIGQSTSMVAHDVRRPLASMKALLNTLPNIKDDHEKVRQMVASVDISISRTNAMLNEILDFSKDKLNLKLDNCNPQSIITSAISESLRSLNDINIKIEYELKHKNYLNVDSNRIIRVFSNIISNAVEAMNGTGNLWIKTFDDRNENVMTIIIGDNGPAIPEDIKEKIFDPFFTKGKESGTGLGLAICKKIIENHKGTISVLGNPQMPSTEFIVTLPSSTGKLELKPEELIYNSEELTQFRKEEINRIEYGDTINTTETMNIHKSIGRSLKVLVVDDEPLFRETIKTLIDNMSPVRDYVKILESESAEFALEILETKDIDYIISDIYLGKDQINGYAFTKTVLENYPNTYIVINSNKRRDEMDDILRDNATKCFMGFLPKPMKKSELLQFLARKTFEMDISNKKSQLKQSPQFKKETVLMLNDDTTLLMSLELMAKNYANIITAEDVDQAIEQYEANKVDLIISDINLRDENKNGYEFLKWVRKRNKNIHIYMLSGYSEVMERPIAIDKGATGYYQLPVDERQIEEIILKKPKHTKYDKVEKETVNQTLAKEVQKDEIKKETALILNDDDILLMSFAMSLKKYDLNILKAKSVEEAKEAFNSNEVNFILSDINLGEGQPDGYDFLNWIRKQNKDLPIYMVSGYSEVMEKPMAIEKGATGYYQLPIEEEQIEEIVLKRPKQAQYYEGEEQKEQDEVEPVSEFKAEIKTDEKIEDSSSLEFDNIDDILKKVVHDINNASTKLVALLQSDKNIDDEQKEFLFEALDEIKTVTEKFNVTKSDFTDDEELYQTIRNAVHDINNPLATLSFIMRSFDEDKVKSKSSLINALESIGNAVRSLPKKD